jgi:hypothetical protein
VSAQMQRARHITTYNRVGFVPHAAPEDRHRCRSGPTAAKPTGGARVVCRRRNGNNRKLEETGRCACQG